MDFSHLSSFFLATTNTIFLLQCLHETSIFPQLEGLFRLAAPPPDVPAAPSPQRGRGRAPVVTTVHAATAKHISFYLNNSVNMATGYMAPRWSVVGGKFQRE